MSLLAIAKKTSLGATFLKQFASVAQVNTVINYFKSLPSFDDDAAAATGGLVAGDFFQTTGAGAAPLDAAGIVMIKQ